MLQLTKRTEYGLIALVHMADQDGRVVSVREIGERYPVPRRLLAEVLKDLSHAGIVESQRGASGGYALSRPPDDITLAQIVSSLEGEPAIANCEGHDVEPAEGCDIAPLCRIRSPLHRIREGIWGLLERTTLRSLTHPSPLVHLNVPTAASIRDATGAPES